MKRERGPPRLDSTNPPRGAPLPESRFAVVLVEPQYPDNVGHVARSMLNFGVGELWLVRAGENVIERARQRAVHAQDVLNHARHVDSLADVQASFEHVIGFAARISTLDKAHLRQPDALPRTVERLVEMAGRVALVFGREDFGLLNEDLEFCDILSTIPTSASYRSMNLSHAVTIALWEVTRAAENQIPGISMATPQEKDVLFASWYELTGVLGFPEHRRRQSLQMFRRVTGRSGITSWEYHRIMGVLSRILKKQDAWPPRPEFTPETGAQDEGEDTDGS